MATLHGSWILDAEPSALLVWGETWRPRRQRRKPGKRKQLPAHPFALGRRELRAQLLERGLIPDAETAPLTGAPLSERERRQAAILPTQRSARGEPQQPLLARKLREEGAAEGLGLHAWKVEGLALTPLEATQLLQALPLGATAAAERDIGDELRFWAHAYRWSLELLARDKFLPAIAEQGEGEAAGTWQPLLDSAADQARFRRLAQQMPDACRASVSDWRDPALPSPQALLLDFIASTLDVQLRHWLETSVPPVKDAALKRWLNALSAPQGDFAIEALDRRRLSKALETWTLPVRDYLGSQALRKLGPNQFRTCFALQPPPQGSETWTLRYGLQAIDDESLFVDAETVWQHPEEQIVYQQRPIERPQELLLTGLALAAQLHSAVAETLEQACPVACSLDPVQAYEFVKGSAWRLRDSGLGTILPPGLTPGSSEKRLGLKIRAQAPQRQQLGLQGLLQFQWDLAIGDRALSREEFERLLAQQSPLVEVDGEWVALQPADVKAAQAMLDESGNGSMQLSVEDAVRLSTGETQTLDKLPVVDFEASGELQALVTDLSDTQALEPIPTPQGFRGELRSYQRWGASWLAFLARWGLGACLADDMGLGKTIQVLALLLHRQERAELHAPTLLVCPTSVLGNWQREVQRFAPTLASYLHHGPDRPQGEVFERQARQADLVVTSYALALRDAPTLQAVDWQGVVLDEAQTIKNPRAKQSQAVRQLAASFRIALTGTPIENRLAELWSILDFLNPGYLGTQQFFQRRFAVPIERYGDGDSLRTLRSLVRPFILRRTKTDADIVRDLPRKQEANVYCGLSREQADRYQQLVDAALADLEGSEGMQRRGKILTLLMQLKQLCNHPALLLNEPQLDGPERSGKLLRLSEMLEEIAAEGDHALIFTQFAQWGKLLQPYLEQRLGGEVPFLYGATRKQQREEMVDRFQNDPAGPRAFILSIKAGGTGLNLTRANHVFHIDRWWNPAVEDQATDRTFRIGQTRNVQVHKFVCSGTLEERIDAAIASKRELAEQTVDAGEEWLSELDTDSLRDLVLLDRQAVMDADGGG